MIMKIYKTKILLLLFTVLLLFIFLSEDQSLEVVMKQLDQQYAPLNMVSMISRHGNETQAGNARDAELLTRERLCRALSMFEVFMQRIKSFLLKDTVSVC